MPTRPSLAPLAGPALRLQPDARLVTLSREGHDRAFEEIVRRYRAPLVRFAASIVPADRAEDVVQEAFARAHAALPQSDADLAIRAWLYRIVRNGALNHLRDERPHEELDPEYDGVPQPPEVAARRAELAATVSAIGALPDAQREAIVKRELEGRGHEEIAADLGVSAGAVRQLIFRARETLRSGLGSLVPLPAVRALLDEGSTRAAAAGAGTAGAAGLAAAGGGSGMALKTGAAVLIAGLAVGSGAALKRHHDGQPEAAEAATPRHGLHAATGDASSRRARAESSGHGRAGAGSPERGDDGGGNGESNGSAGASHGHEGSGGDEGSSEPGHSGHEAGDDDGEDHSGSGGDDGGSGDSSGSGDDGDDGDDGSGNPGPGGGDDDEGEDPEPDPDPEPDDEPEQDLGD